MKQPLVAPMDSTFGAASLLRDAPGKLTRKRGSHPAHKATSADGRHLGFFKNKGRAFGAAREAGGGDVQTMDSADCPDGTTYADN